VGHQTIGWNAAELAGLQGSLFAELWDGEAMARLIAHDNAAAFLARGGERAETVGYILAMVAADEAEILSLGVRKDRQRRGVATRLIAALSLAAIEAGARRLYLEVAADNGPALALYRRLGFQQAWRRRAYYRRADRTTRDALILSLAL